MATPDQNIEVKTVVEEPEKNVRKEPVRGRHSARDAVTPFEKVIQINRVAKVVKGGKRFHFSALVVTGNGAGEVGYALGKANEVSDAIRKALAQSRKKQFKVALDKTTIPHDVIGHFGAAKVILRRGVPGTGIIAGGAVRALCECAGIKDILTKSLGSDNAINVLKAAIHGLDHLIVRPRETEEVKNAG